MAEIIIIKKNKTEDVTPEALNGSFLGKLFLYGHLWHAVDYYSKTGNTFTVMHLQQKTTMMWCECFYYVY